MHAPFWFRSTVGSAIESESHSVEGLLGQKKKIVMLPSPDQNVKIGSVGRDFFIYFFFFFFLRTVRELSFPIFFFKFLNGENSGGMQSKRIYKSCKCFFKPLNTNFSKFFAQIWHKKKKKKKKTTLFFRILRSVGRGQHNNFFFGLRKLHAAPLTDKHTCSIWFIILCMITKQSHN